MRIYDVFSDPGVIDDEMTLVTDEHVELDIDHKSTQTQYICCW
jgi:hypothetical protein